MNSVRTLDRIGDEIVTLVRGMQDFTAATVESVVRPLERLVPKLPWPQTLTPPTAKSVVESIFRFQEQLAEGQKEFVLRLVSAIEPLLRPIREPRPASRSARAA